MDQETKLQEIEIEGNLGRLQSIECDNESSSKSYKSSDTTKQLYVEDPLDVSPPDFELAKIHQNASRVKFMSQRKVSEAFL